MTVGSDSAEADGQPPLAVAMVEWLVLAPAAWASSSLPAARALKLKLRAGLCFGGRRCRGQRALGSEGPRPLPGR